MHLLNKQTSLAAILLLSIGVFSSGAYANVVPVGGLCSDSADHPDGLDVSNMTFNNSTADGCYGVVTGNDDGDNVWTDTGWNILAKSDGPEGVDNILGIKFDLTDVVNGDKSGTWTLSWEKVAEPEYNLTMDVVGVLKSSDRFASYLFNDLEFTSNGSFTGTWEVKYVNNGSKIPELSHLSLYYKNASSVKPDPDPRPPTGVPEPGLVALFGMGLLGMGLSHIRRRRKAV